MVINIKLFQNNVQPLPPFSHCPLYDAVIDMLCTKGNRKHRDLSLVSCMVPSLDTMCTLHGLVTTGQYAYVHCKYTLFYAIKKLFISNKKLAPLIYWFVPVWNMVCYRTTSV